MKVYEFFVSIVGKEGSAAVRRSEQSGGDAKNGRPTLTGIDSQVWQCQHQLLNTAIFQLFSAVAPTYGMVKASCSCDQ
jgi:hypothetical protein